MYYRLHQSPHRECPDDLKGLLVSETPRPIYSPDSESRLVACEVSPGSKLILSLVKCQMCLHM